MNKSRLFNWFLTILLFIFFSCEQDVELSSKIDTEFNAATKALSIDEPSISNPDLHNNWENVRKIYLNGGGVIDAPWIYAEGNNMNIPRNYREDIKKVDG